MSLRDAYGVGYAGAFSKFGMSLGFKQQALTNAAARSGARLAPAALAQAGNPAAFRSMAANVRAPGALAPSAQQAQLHGLLETVPWAGSEHGGTPFAHANYDRMLQQTGRAYTAPGLQQQIMAEHGQPMRQMGAGISGYEPTEAATPISRRRVA